ncbi:unnamed protein product [Psylliodes chrysocephalus]|uniref:Uncharacterized protein n=1 Tax=Psylliodes chrysocephalus TaxID=3402493 RepID=A0A9P0G4L3_9CUCU|nr:unnamed protein product [Psylliodes chrysocephala]
MNPFISNSTNLTDESFFSSAPTFINGQNVFVSQEKNRKILDSVHTSVIGNPPISYNGISSYGFYPGNYIKAEKHFLPPSGVLFTFSPHFGQHYGTTNHSTQAHQINPLFSNLNELPNLNSFCCTNHAMPRRTGGVSGMGHPHNAIPPNGFGGADYQHLSQNPFFYQCQKYPFYKLKFHMDNCTSCSDLLNGITQVPGSQGTADFNNICGLNIKHERNSLYQGSPNNSFDNGVNGVHDDTVQTQFGNDRTGVRHLNIRKPVTPPKCHVADAVDEKLSNCCETVNDQQDQQQQQKPEQHQVETCEKSEQTSFSCDGEEAERSKSKGKKLTKKNSKKKKNPHLSSSEENPCPKTCRTRRKKKKPESEHETSSSSATE